MTEQNKNKPVYIYIDGSGSFGGPIYGAPKKSAYSYAVEAAQDEIKAAKQEKRFVEASVWGSETIQFPAMSSKMDLKAIQAVGAFLTSPGMNFHSHNLDVAISSIVNRLPYDTVARNGHFILLTDGDFYSREAKSLSDDLAKLITECPEIQISIVIPTDVPLWNFADHTKKNLESITVDLKSDRIRLHLCAKEYIGAKLRNIITNTVTPAVDPELASAREEVAGLRKLFKEADERLKKLEQKLDGPKPSSGGPKPLP